MNYLLSAFVLLLGQASTVTAFVPLSSSTSSHPSCATKFIGKNEFQKRSVQVLNLSTRTEDSSNYRSPPREFENPLTELSKGYSRLTTDHYLAMAFLQAGVLASGADMATQVMEGAGPIDFTHVAAMATVASTMSGATNAVWLRQLEQKFPGTGTKEVAAKTLIHAVILASIINSAYLVGVPLFGNYYLAAQQGTLQSLPPLDLSVIFAGWSMDEFFTLTKLEVMMFIPYNTLAFKFVPPQVRPLTHATISATFNVAVSAITLGCFNTWCDNAMSVFGQWIMREKKGREKWKSRTLFPLFGQREKLLPRIVNIFKAAIAIILSISPNVNL